MYVLMLALGYVVGSYVHLNREIKAFLRGFNDAKQFYHDNRLAEEIAERQRRSEEQEQEYNRIDAENRQYPPVTSDLLMAYGVSRIGELPNSIKERYNIKEDQYGIDLDTMLRKEQGDLTYDA
jgi:hypothetical protein